MCPGTGPKEIELKLPLLEVGVKVSGEYEVSGCIPRAI
jgi:hypothetical protein